MGDCALMHLIHGMSIFITLSWLLLNFLVENIKKNKLIVTQTCTNNTTNGKLMKFKNKKQLDK